MSALGGLDMCQAVASARMEPVLCLAKKNLRSERLSNGRQHSHTRHTIASLHSHLATLARDAVPHPLLARPVLSQARCTRARDLAPSLELHGAEVEDGAEVEKEVETQR